MCKTLEDWLRLVGIHGEVLPLIPDKNMTPLIEELSRLFGNIKIEFNPLIKNAFFDNYLKIPHYDSNLRVIRPILLIKSIILIARSDECTISKAIEVVIKMGMIFEYFRQGFVLSAGLESTVKLSFFFTEECLNSTVSFSPEANEEFFKVLEKIRI